jgi:hydrogenase nickel incorporation protein HypA/HybF
MHEFALCETVVRMLQYEYKECTVRERPGKTPGVRTVRLVVGGMHQLVEESFRLAYEVLTTDTPLSGSELIIEKTAVRARCPACGWEGAITMPFFLCGRCGRGGLETTAGNEFYLKDMEIEDDEPENI